MAKKNTDAERVERREAGKAVAEAKRVGKEAAKRAKTLPHDARSNLEAVTATVDAEVREARRTLGVRPRRAKRVARKATARLRKASVLATGSVLDERRALVKIDAKQRAEATKRRRTGAKQAQQMVKLVTDAIAASVTTPPDVEHAEKDQKRTRRDAKGSPVARGT